MPTYAWVVQGISPYVCSQDVRVLRRIARGYVAYFAHMWPPKEGKGYVVSFDCVSHLCTPKAAGAT